MEFFNLIWQSLYLLLPAYFGNTAATLSFKFEFLQQLSRPIDNNKNFGRYRLFGDNKTWRGLLFSLTMTFLIIALQKFCWQFEMIKNISPIDFEQVSWPLLGLLAALGNTGGDLLASFFKRRWGIKSGAFLPLVDQWNNITGYFLLIGFLTRLAWPVIIMAYVLTLIIQPLSNILAYFLKLKKVWW